MAVSTKSMAASKGLSSQEAAALLGKYGPNVVTAKKTSQFSKVLRWFVSPMSLLLIAAAALSFYLGRAFDGWFILALFIANFVISRWHEAKADKAIATLQRKLTVTVQVVRDGTPKPIRSDQIVLGDVVRLAVGNLVPADLLIAEVKNLSINSAALTGESLPQDKQEGDSAYAGSFVATGSLVGIVTQTGNKTKFGKAVTMVDSKPKNSVLQKDIVRISKFLTITSVSAAAIITIALLPHQNIAELLTLDLSVLIAGVPVAMPTVMSLIISLGVVQLTRKHVVVRRLSSLEDLANVNLLLSDKTGTLTKNEIDVEDTIAYGTNTVDDVLQWAYSVTGDNKLNTINQAIVARAQAAKLTPYKQLDFTPADSKRKHSTATVEVHSKVVTVSLGAPQIIETLCRLSEPERRKLRADVDKAAAAGFRSLVVAEGRGRQEEQLTLVGMLLLSDTLRPDARGVIGFLQQHGIAVKMMTGDNQAIAARVAKSLGLVGDVLRAAGKTSHLRPKQIEEAGAFTEVLPDDKFRIVKAAAAAHFVVAATGDGANDLPALRQASVGIAVKNSVDALKSAADIVLLTNGIGVIRNAIIEARKVFDRTYYYSIYRISESFRLILTIAVLSIANGTYPLTPVQIILLALLNDLPIISLAYDRVVATTKPSAIHVRERFGLASIYGLIGVFTSISFFYLMKDVLHLQVAVIQTMFFLKLTVSGHLLIYVVHTKEHWWRWLPSKQVILATALTQLAATIIAVSGIFFQGVTIWQAALVWGWALAWMQVCEVAKRISQRYFVI